MGKCSLDHFIVANLIAKRSSSLFEIECPLVRYRCFIANLIAKKKPFSSLFEVECPLVRILVAKRSSSLSSLRQSVF